MPPKAKGKKDGPAKFADKENLARAETEVLSLQRLLELRSFEAIESRRSERLWRERNEAFSTALQQQREDTLDITSDMVRQHKAMQEQLSKRVSDLEAQNKTLREALDEKDELINNLLVDAEAVRKAREAEALEYKRKNEDIQHQFAQMLRDALDKMHERLAEKMLDK
jgi:citrate synthase